MNTKFLAFTTRKMDLSRGEMMKTVRKADLEENNKSSVLRTIIRFLLVIEVDG